MERGSIVKFVVLGKASTAKYNEKPEMNGFHAAIGDKLVSLKDEIDFVVMTGNNFLDRGVQNCDDPQWEEVWFKHLRVKDLNVPWFTVLGETDIRGNPSAQYSFHKCTGKEEMSKYWVTPSTDYFLKINQNIRIFFLNTNNEDPTSIEGISRGISETHPNIVIGHHPIHKSALHEHMCSLQSRSETPRETNLQTYICGHEPILNHVVEDEKSRIVVGTSGGLLTWSYRDYTAINGTCSLGGTPTAPFNDKLYGFAVVTVASNDDAKLVEFFTYHQRDNGIFYWEDSIRQVLY
ncbi:unnamed protein product [Albugo candida]|uniref:Calcineurin-like phosphoesterase domain-containing protein n=1 Tax=Albugo candida TaxID=65357 RepID=A0A024FV19_9STRA|nr:unnamed protein product [Albugo candida]|eukprot:CCI10782.1 unnamed protein product [Albugo candida]